MRAARVGKSRQSFPRDDHGVRARPRHGLSRHAPRRTVDHLVGDIRAVRDVVAHGAAALARGIESVEVSVHVGCGVDLHALKYSTDRGADARFQSSTCTFSS